MLKLKGVSKFYYSKGIVASGFNKISLNFKLGEFVAITGESGSGKSTLLNVLSGLDSYEEGEMYINGKETSHYTEKDYEIYRKKYIGNIFQNFNLVNSYTVYQNVELVLLLNGYKKREIKEKVLKIIKDVDLYKYRNRKVSKLSGGQKQRVAIARALAKDTPIILADEPTGNLDSKSSESVLKLLSEIAKEKLVIIVTHNYEQIEKYATRKITMHDGKVLEDKKIKDYTEVEDAKEATFRDVLWYNKLRLGIRNTFNIIPKFLLIFAVYMFVILAFTSAYSAFKKSEFESSNQGYNQFFQETSNKRIVINKYDRTVFTDEDYEKISKISNVDYIVKNDLSLDNNVSISSDMTYLFGKVKNINDFKSKLDIGEMPKEDNEIIIVGDENSYFMRNDPEELLSTSFNLEELTNYTTNEHYPVRITGIKYDSVSSSNYDSAIEIYASDNVINRLVDRINKDYSKLYYTFAGKESVSYYNSIVGEIIPTSYVPSGKYVIPEDMKYQCKNSNCKRYNYYLDLKVENVYFEATKSLSYSNYYNKKNFYKVTGYDYDKYNGAIFINDADYNDLFNKGYFQSSVFIKDIDNKNITIKLLNDLGIKTLYIKDTLVNYAEEDMAIINIAKVISLSVLLFALFFISYFIIKIILKSRNVYFATLRILGSTATSVKQLLNIELFTIFNLAFIIFVSFLVIVNNDIIKIEYFKNMYSYLSLIDYVFIYLILFVMSRLITSRYSRKLFNTSAMNAYREEV